MSSSLTQSPDSAPPTACEARPLKVAFVTCSYDTAHEPLLDQLRGRVDQVSRAFPAAPASEGDPGVDWSLWVVDDLPPEEGFGSRVRWAAGALGPLPSNAALHVVPLGPRRQTRVGLKGRALLEGIARAVEIDDPDVIVYLNLNLKVDAAFAVPGVRAVAAGEADVAIGTRASAEGGQALGRGLLGEAKSRGFNLLARALLPALRPYADTNAPLKVLSRRAAGLLLEEARVPHVTLDCEWLVIFHAHRLRVQAYPVVWRQRDGSKIPWHVTGQSLLDLIHLRRRAFNRSPTCSKP